MIFEPYEEMCNHMMETKSKDIFSNFDVQHAQYILNQLVSNANRNINIFVKNYFNASYNFSNDFYDILKNKSLSSCNVRIITFDGNIDKKFKQLENEVNEVEGIENKLYIQAKYTPKKTIQKDINPKKIDKSSYKMKSYVFEEQYEEKMNSFIVCDGKMYRLEAAGVNSNFNNCLPNSTKAEVCYNNFDKAQELDFIFNSMWEKLNNS